MSLPGTLEPVEDEASQETTEEVSATAHV
jgi:hypothetical protein